MFGLFRPFIHVLRHKIYNYDYNISWKQGWTILEAENIVRKKIRKRRLFKKVQAFCEEKVLRYLLGVFWYAESKNQCWQAEKWRLHYLICIFSKWPPNWRKNHKNLESNVLRMPNWFKPIQKYLLMIRGLHWHQFMQLELKIRSRDNQGGQLEQKILLLTLS